MGKYTAQEKKKALLIAIKLFDNLKTLEIDTVPLIKQAISMFIFKHDMVSTIKEIDDTITFYAILSDVLLSILDEVN